MKNRQSLALAAAIAAITLLNNPLAAQSSFVNASGASGGAGGGGYGSAVPSEDLSQFPTADQLWRHISDLRSRRATSAMEAQANSLHVLAALTEFVNRYPADPRKWDAQLMSIEMTPRRIGQATTDADYEPLEALFRPILDAADAPPAIKQSARLQLVEMEFGYTSPAAFPPKLDQALDAFAKDYPDNPALAYLDERRVALLQKNDPDRARSLIEEMAQSSNAAVARMGKGLIKQRELMTNPINLKFTALDGTQVDLAGLRGKVVLIDFWATWCGPCMAAVPRVVAASQQYQSRGLQVIGVSLDQNRDAVLRVTQEKGMTWPQYFDGQGWNNQLSSSYAIDSIPRLWLINKQGLVVDLNFDVRGNFTAEIEKLLAE